MTALPPTDRSTLERQYRDGSTLDARASIYANQEPRFDLPAIALELLGAVDGVVVDVGCGRGQYLTALRTAGHHAVGFDLSPGMAPDVVGDAASLPFADGAAGAGLAMHMLYHLAEPAAGLRELRRVVRPDGPIVVLTNHVDHLGDYRALLDEAAGQHLVFPTETFSLDHRSLVEDVLGPVELHELTGTLTITEVEPLVAYAASAREFYEHLVDDWDAVVARLAMLVRLPFVTRTRSGFFVSRARPG